MTTGSKNQPSTVGSAVALGCLVVPFIVVGVVLAGVTISEAQGGSPFDRLALLAIASLAFGGSGLAAAAAGFAAVKRMKEERRLREEHPGEPWMWRRDWRDRQVRSSSRSAAIGMIVFAVLWNLISAPVLLIVPSEVRDGNYAALIGLLFPLVGVGLVIAAGVKTARWLRFGEAVAELEALPFRPGGELRLTLRLLRGAMPPRTPVSAKLRAIKRVTTGTGKNRRTEETDLWAEKRTVPPDDIGSATVPIRFEIPAGAPSTAEIDTRTSVLWRLEVDADIPGANLDYAFELPVYGARTAEPSDGL